MRWKLKQRGGALIAAAAPIPSPSPAPAPTPSPTPSPAGVPRYVALTGSDANDGLTTGTPWRTIQKAAQTLTAGQTAHIKAGNYGSEAITFANSGSAGNPIQLVGYTTTPGDAPTLKSLSYPITMNSAVLPMLNRGDRTGGIAVLLTGKSYIQISNLQVQQYDIGFYGDGASCTNNILTNCFTKTIGNTSVDYSGVAFKFGTSSTNNTVLTCVSENSCSEGIMVGGSGNTVDNCLVYANDATSVRTAQDYYIQTNGNSNTIRNCLVHRIGALPHGGHGIGTKTNAANNIIEDNEVINSESESFYCKHTGSTGNIFRRNIARNGGGFGIAMADGANNNTVEDHTITSMATGIMFYYVNEEGLGLGIGGDNNTFTRVTITGGSYAIRHAAMGSFPNTTSSNNTLNQCIIDGAAYLYYTGHICNNLVFNNGTIKNCTNKDLFESGKSAADRNVSYTGSNTFTGNGFSLP